MNKFTKSIFSRKARAVSTVVLGSNYTLGVTMLVVWLLHASLRSDIPRYAITVGLQDVSPYP